MRERIRFGLHKVEQLRKISEKSAAKFSQFKRLAKCLGDCTYLSPVERTILTVLALVEVEILDAFERLVNEQFWSQSALHVWFALIWRSKIDIRNVLIAGLKANYRI